MIISAISVTEDVHSEVLLNEIAFMCIRLPGLLHIDHLTRSNYCAR